ncbi:hypothetical protein DFA_02223 [Cavenderia fasciculata]|uniref:snRNA-activating protein complex subunit 3 n=1 Tax=Cavenderia fasciculata TaxID=261658 RepID=F4PYV1_CACFS|nr:uncharacterized protein DFA_02223 [Cavenderia fasciculata]EGG18980.1 hypothetical protein DFA_02223 [Cavenderia fasciculata]|eukprot:XP_004357459.1 hypothetical protein DFA_02223 [Cavenderia fasciculata]
MQQQQRQQQQQDDSDNEETTTLPALSFNNNIKSAVINVANFQNDYFNAILQESIDPTLELLSPNISVNDIKPKTHYQIVENEIKSSLFFTTSPLTNSSSPPTNNFDCTLSNESPLLLSPCLMSNNNNQNNQNNQNNNNNNNNTTTTTTTTNSTQIPFHTNTLGVELPIISFDSISNNMHLDINYPEPLSSNEIILSVVLYHPQKSSKIQEFLVIGSQKLTDLRDKIYCMRDNILDGWKRKSCFFFINNVFYNDLREPENIPYSNTINEWILKKGDTSGGSFLERDMSLYCFNEMDISIGEKYLYCNQGNCEHILVFKQMRLINAKDSFKRSDYPIETYHAKLRRKKCKVCEIYPAKFVTVGDKLVDETPYFFCEECYRIFHYDKEGRLLYNDYENATITESKKLLESKTTIQQQQQQTLTKEEGA